VLSDEKTMANTAVVVGIALAERVLGGSDLLPGLLSVVRESRSYAIVS
jgi:hypothetical protein